MGFIDQIYALAHEQRMRAAHHPEYTPEQKATKTEAPVESTAIPHSLSDVLGETGRQMSFADVVADTFTAPFQFHEDASTPLQDDAVARARLEARERAAKERARARKSSGYLHDNPVGISSNPHEAEKAVFASATAMTKEPTPSTSFTQHVHKKAAAGGAQMLVKRASADAIDMAMKIEQANQLEAQKNLNLHKEIRGV